MLYFSIRCNYVGSGSVLDSQSLHFFLFPFVLCLFFPRPSEFSDVFSVYCIFFLLLCLFVWLGFFSGLDLYGLGMCIVYFVLLLLHGNWF